MFTGIIEGKGEISDISSGDKGFLISISSDFNMSADKIGDSVAVNGICLTASSIHDNNFTAHVSEETLSRTSLAHLKKGDEVNLERALKVGDRFGGHIVSGHIDGTGSLITKEQRGNSIYMEVGAGKEIMRYIIEKGSVAIDGISLTVNKVMSESFSLNIVPHTLEVTTLDTRRSGDTVNIETDIIGKYIEKLSGKNEHNSKVDMDLLAKCGFV